MIALRIADVAKKTTLAEQTIRNWVSARRFPKPFKLGTVSVWDAADIDQWLLTQKQESINETGRSVV